MQLYGLGLSDSDANRIRVYIYEHCGVDHCVLCRTIAEATKGTADEKIAAVRASLERGHPGRGLKVRNWQTGKRVNPQIRIRQ